MSQHSQSDSRGLREAWRIPGEPMVFNIDWNSKEVGSSISEGFDELVSDSRGKQAKSKAAFFHAPLVF